MLASPWTEPPDGPDWIFEVKWDGYRAIAIIEPLYNELPETINPRFLAQ
jgi:bifunctional non-homologous end joining protein LigD